VAEPKAGAAFDVFIRSYRVKYEKAGLERHVIFWDT
jgi:hypothetical protein